MEQNVSVPSFLTMKTLIQNLGFVDTVSSKMFFPFLRYLNFWLDFFVHVGKRLDKQANVDFKIHGVIHWETNNCNIHITQYLKRQRQPDNEIC